jgi:hypothetical protein
MEQWGKKKTKRKMKYWEKQSSKIERTCTTG